ncbi:hypothetical protein L1887_44319 [Cichorium endivia]|nr:hypothetical protein L1887_44319 [Cichorium endivia]
MSGEHIRNEYGSSRCTRKEARLLAILTSRVTVWGIDYVAESPVKELSYVPVLDVSLIPRMGTESRSHKRMNGTPGPDRTRDSDNPGNRQKEMGRILESAQKSLLFRGRASIRIWPTPRTAGCDIFMDWQSELSI